MTSAIFSFLFILTTALTQPATGVNKEAALDQEFEIKIGQQVSIRREGLKISFTAVAEDSRCPEGVQCIWAGNGKIVLRLSKARKRAGVIRLNTTTEPKQVDYRGYDVKLVSLNPYPKQNAPIKRKDYVATLMVSRK
jgi:hypothetical protein